MSDRLFRIEARLGGIDQALADVHRRLDALEALELRSPPALRSGPLSATIEAPSRAPLLSGGGLDVTALVSLVGRTFVVLGGAYLLRAFTESGRLPGRAGVVLGLAYAVAWFGAADRAAVTRPLSGLFHGLVAVVISLSLLWEASAHFKLLSPETSAELLSLIAGLALGVAWHRHLQSLAGVAVVGSIVATAGLMVATGYPLPFATGLLALGACTLWLSDARTWPWLRWLPALAADLGALVLVGRGVVVPPQEPPAAVIALLLALVAVYLGSVARRTLVRNQRVQGFEVIQTPCAVGIGLLGAMIVARGGPRLVSLALAALALLGAGAGYAAAFGILRRRPDGRANVVFFGTLAVGLLLIGSSASLGGPALVAWYGALAVVAAALGLRASEPQLSLHAIVLGFAVAAASGTLIWATDAWFTGPWRPLPGGTVATVVVAAACLAIPPTASGAGPDGVRVPFLASVSRFILGVVLVVVSGGIVVWWLAPLVAGEPVDPGVFASITTIVLAASAVAVAAVFRITSWVEFQWLVYPVLVAGGLKLVVDDFRHSTPATLFAALAVYGVVLILAPRLLRRRMVFRNTVCSSSTNGTRCP